MNYKPTFSIPEGISGEETTGRYIVTFRDDGEAKGLDVLKKKCGISKLPSAADFSESAIDTEEFETVGGAVFPKLGVAVVSLDDDALNNLMGVAGEDATILDVEPERMFYALTDEGSLSLPYLRGYRDAVNHLFQQATCGATEEEGVEAAVTYADDAQSTWGLKATKVVNSRYTGRNIKVAVLDTGMDLEHPDFRGRSIRSRSFISGQDVQDGNGHGTHCIGTACGRKDMNGRRYGVAGNATIFVGKVLSNGGSGKTSGILAGMEWAIASGCQVISMSLGNRTPHPSTAYEAIGQRALKERCLIVAAAGNHRRQGNYNEPPPGTVSQPANSPSILAVAAIDSRLRLASFSCKSGTAVGANVDIAGPGVEVYSSWPTNVPPKLYRTISGTSMATPHVAGIAALYAEAYRARGEQLWQLLVSRACRLPLPTPDVGSGLVMAPV